MGFQPIDQDRGKMIDPSTSRSLSTRELESEHGGRPSDTELYAATVNLDNAMRVIRAFALPANFFPPFVFRAR